MARNLFGGSSDDYAADANGRALPNRRIRFHTSAAMTTEITDLASDAAGTGAPLSVSTDAHGFWGPVYGPDTVTVMYAGAADGVGNPPTYAVAVYTHSPPAGGVATFNGRAGAVSLSKADVTGTALAAADVGAQNVVVHGSTAGTARPAGATVVHWIGSVAPSNAATNDEWTDTTSKLLKRWNGSSFDALGSAAYLGLPSGAPAGTIGAPFAATKRNRALATLADSIGTSGCNPQMAVATLSAPANATDTSVTVTGIGAPGVIGDFVVSGSDATVKIGSEFCRVTAASGSTLTIASPGLAGAHAAGEAVVSIPTLFNFGAPSAAVTAVILSKGQLIHGGMYGHASATTTQLATTYLPLVLAAQPGYCYVEAGRNDLGDGVAATTTATAARVVAMWDALLAVGTLPIASTIPPVPSGSTAGYIKQNQDFNSIIVAEAAKRGIPVTDLYALMVDPATGNYLAAYLNDGVHPNANGRWVQGVDIWTTLSNGGLAHVEPGLPVTQAYADTSVYILGHSAANAIFSTGGGGNFGGGTSNPPAGWQTSVADAIAKVTVGAVAGWAGQGMTFTKTASASGTGQVQTAANATLVAGHRYRIKCRIKTSGVAAARTADSGFNGWSLWFSHQGFSTSKTIFMLDQMYQDITDGVLIADFVAPMQPTSPAGLAVVLQVPGTASTPSYTVTLGQVVVEDLTALGESSAWPL